MGEGFLMEQDKKKCLRMVYYRRTYEEEDDDEDNGNSIQHTAFTRIMVSTRSRGRRVLTKDTRTPARGCVTA